MNIKLKETLRVLDNVPFKYRDTKNYIEENLMAFCEGEGLTVGEVIYFVVCLCLRAFE